MANKFEIQVVALDRFTKVFRNLNESASRAVRPLTNTQRQVGALFREMKLPQVVSGFRAASRSVISFANGLGQVAAPLQSLLGIGAAGGVVGALAGVAALTTSWARAGFEVSKTSTAIGVSARDLQRWRGAAKLAGLDTEVMTQGLSSLASTLQDAAFGRNPVALILLTKLGIPLRRGADGVVDVTGTLEDLSRALSRISDPQVRRVVASAFGLEGALPLLMQGPDAIRRLSEEAERLGVVQGPKALKWAEDFSARLDKLWVSLTGAGNAVGALLAPAAVQSMDWMSRRAEEAARDPIGAMKKNLGDLFTGRAQRDFLFGPPVENRRRVSGVVTDEQGRPIAGPGLQRRSGDWRDPAQLARDEEAVRIIRQEREATSDPAMRASLAREIERLGGQVEITVNIPNAPAGTTVTANSSGPPVRIGATGEW